MVIPLLKDFNYFEKLRGWGPLLTFWDYFNKNEQIRGKKYEEKFKNYEKIKIIWNN